MGARSDTGLSGACAPGPACPSRRAAELKSPAGSADKCRVLMPEELPDSRMPRVACALGAIVALAGALIVLGWVLDTVIVPSGVGVSPMVKANAGICFVLAGIGLALAGASRAALLGRLLGAIVAVIGVLTLIDSLFMVDVGLNQLLFSDPSPLDPGCMAPNAAVGFILCGAALLPRRRAGSWRLVETLGLAASLIGWLAAIGFAAGLSQLARVGTFVEMGLPTAICFLLLGAGLVLTAPAGRVRALLASRGPAGRLVRRLLGAVIVVPLVAGVVLRAGRAAGVLDTGAVVLLLVASVGVTLLAVALSFARSLDGAEAQRLRAEQGLRDSERRHREVVEASIDAVVAMDGDGAISAWNPAAEALFGWSSEEAIGLKVADTIVPASLRPRHEAGMARVAAGGAPTMIGQRAELPALCRDGRQIPVELSISMSEGLDGRRFHAFLHDISERKVAERKLADAARFFDLSSDMVCTASLQGCFLQLGGSWEATLGWSAHELRSRPLPEFVHPDDREATRAALAELADGATRVEFANRHETKDGAWRWLEWTAVGPPELGLIYAAARDVTGRVESDAARRDAEERFRRAFDSSPIGMALLELDGRFSKVNDALRGILGYPRDQLEGLGWDSITNLDDIGGDREAMRAMRAGESTSYATEKRYLHSSGDSVCCAVQATFLSSGDGAEQHFLTQVQDVTERKRHEERLEYLADHDALTGLLNRRAFKRELGAHAALAERYGTAGTVLIIDLDHFKYVNDTLGHQAGDELIVRVAQLLGQRLRASDVLARPGGDEFAVLLPKAPPGAAMQVARSLLATLRDEAIRIAGIERPITASIGVASFEDQGGLSAEDVLVNADLAMYDAKQDGRDRISLFSDDQHRQASMKGRASWAQRIQSALETDPSDHFTLLARPIVDLATRHVAHYELLPRMTDDHGELIPPSAFRQIAERLGVIGQIDAWVVTRAIRLLADLDDQRVALEINLSGRSLGDSAVVDQIDRELRGARVAPERIIFDFLKIEGEIVRNCRADNADRLVIEALVAIARGLGKSTIAQGVGDEETASLLTRLGIDYGQGDYLGMPAPVTGQLSISAGSAAGAAILVS